MALIDITEDSILPFIQSAEVSIPSSDSLGAMILACCNEVAGYVNACPRNVKVTLGVCKVPEELEKVACVLIKWSIIASVPSMAAELEGSTRSTEYQSALSTLRSVANGSFMISSGSSAGSFLFKSDAPQDWSNPL